MTDPQPDFRPTVGQPTDIAPGIRRIVAPNPSPMTFRGTNTYLVGSETVAVIDPGPIDDRHLAAILDAVGSPSRITHILVTHAHLDHSPLARRLSHETGAPVLAFGDARAGRRPIMQSLAETGLLGGGEGVDDKFAPDVLLADGDRIETAEWRIDALHLPGHMANHLGFALGERLFSGDLVMGWATSLVSPPDGDLTSFMASLDRLSQGNWSQFLPGHGAPVSYPDQRIKELVAHRRSRGQQIKAALDSGPATPAELTRRIYTDVAAELLPAAERNVVAHLLEMVEKRIAYNQDALSHAARFSLY